MWENAVEDGLSMTTDTTKTMLCPEGHRLDMVISKNYMFDIGYLEKPYEIYDCIFCMKPYFDYQCKEVDGE